MIKIPGYKKVAYSKFLDAMNAARKESGKSHIQIAADINSKTAETARNAFKQDSDGEQIVSDKVLVKIMDCISFNGMAVWAENKKHYFIEDAG